MARHGHNEANEQLMAFRTGMDDLKLCGELESAEDPNFIRLNEALKALRRSKPLAKPRLIKACAAVALADGHLNGREGAMAQGIAATLDCPLPPSIYHATESHD